MARRPITILTGFLGSGKTTILAGVLATPGIERVAVIVNDIGEYAVDGAIVAEITESLSLLPSGCLCCEVRSELVDTIRNLIVEADAGKVPPFGRIAIETTGLADPGPALQSLLGDVVLVEGCRLDGIVATADALHASAQLVRHSEARRQIAVADRILLTKTDLANANERAAAVNAIRANNPSAPIIVTPFGAAAPDHLFHAGLYDARSGQSDPARWLNLAAANGPVHRNGINTVALRFEDGWDWSAFARWIAFLMAAQGESLLRLKGIVNVRGEARPVVVHGIHHRLHPPAVLQAWPDADRATKLVFIAEGLDAAALRKSAEPFLRGGGF